MGRIITVGPNTAVVVTSSKTKKIVSGGWAYAVPHLDNVQYLSLNLMTLRPECLDVETAEGVPVNVTAVAQCKIMNTPESLLIAAEHFLGRRTKQIARSLVLTLEGHLRAILGSLTVEEIFKDRIGFANLVREVAAKDVVKMGIQIVSFVIKNIDDTVGYLSALGKRRTAQVKRDAAIGVAYAERDAGIREAECEREANAVVFEMQSKIQNYKKMFNLKQSEYNKEVDSAKAEAQLAHSLEQAKVMQLLRHEEMAIEIIEKIKNIEIEEKEIERKKLELIAQVNLQSDAESYSIEKIAEGKKTCTLKAAIGESEQIKQIGEAEADIKRLRGVGEGERMYKKATILKTYPPAAIKHLILQSLPELTSNIVAPLAKIDEILILSGNNSALVDNIITLSGQVPPALKTLQVGDVKQVVNKVLNS